MNRLPKFLFDLTVVLSRNQETIYIHKNNLDNNLILVLEDYAKLIVSKKRLDGFYVKQIYAHNFRFMNNFGRVYLYTDAEFEGYGDADAW